MLKSKKEFKRQRQTSEQKTFETVVTACRAHNITQTDRVHRRKKHALTYKYEVKIWQEEAFCQWLRHLYQLRRRSTLKLLRKAASSLLIFTRSQSALPGFSLNHHALSERWLNYRSED